MQACASLVELGTFAASENVVFRSGCVWVADGCGFKPVEAVHRGFVPAWHEVPVDIHRNLDAVMSELLLYIDQGFAVMNEEGGEGVPQIMQADMAQACLGQQFVPHPIAEVSFIEQRAVRCDEHPGGNISPPFPQRLFLPFEEQRLERVAELLAHVHEPRLAVLGRCDPSTGVGPSHFDKAALEIKISPLYPSASPKRMPVRARREASG